MTTENEQTAEQQAQKDIPAIPFTVEGELPEKVMTHIGALLKVGNGYILDGEEVPLMAAVLNNDSAALINELNSLPNHRIAGMVIGTLAAQQNATAVLIISEGYALPPNEMDKFARGETEYQQISDHPQHYEVLRLTVETNDGHWLGVAPFNTRFKEGEVRTLTSNMHFQKFQEAHGPLTNLLPQNMKQRITSMLENLSQGEGCGECPACLAEKAAQEAAAQGPHTRH